MTSKPPIKAHLIVEEAVKCTKCGATGFVDSAYQDEYGKWIYPKQKCYNCDGTGWEYID